MDPVDAARGTGPWDRASATYDRQLAVERRAVSVALDLAAPRGSEALLDVGTGTGAVLRALERRAERPAVAVGVDASGAMLARVPALPAGWHVTRADATCLPFADASFGVAIAAYVLHVLDPPARAGALSELRRTLGPRGRLVTVTPILPARSATRPLCAGLSGLARRRAGPGRGLSAFDPRADLVRAGFELERARTVRRGYFSLCVLARQLARPA